MQVIKWFNEPIWTQNVILDNAPYVLSANYNTRADGWFMDIYTSDDVPLVLGKKLTLGINLLNNIYNELMPKGQIFVVPVADNVFEITRDNMGIEVQIIFVGIDETIL